LVEHYEKERKQPFIPLKSAKNWVFLPAYFDECIDAVGNHQAWETVFNMFCIAYVFILATLYLVFYSFTRFHAGESTSQQRGWLISWVVFNQLGGLVPFFINSLRDSASDNWMIGKRTRITTYSIMIPLSVAAIGGYYTIISELLEFGTCFAL